jgi:hypothetical protein
MLICCMPLKPRRRQQEQLKCSGKSDQNCLTKHLRFGLVQIGNVVLILGIHLFKACSVTPVSNDHKYDYTETSRCPAQYHHELPLSVHNSFRNLYCLKAAYTNQNSQVANKTKSRARILRLKHDNWRPSKLKMESCVGGLRIGVSAFSPIMRVLF